MPTVGGVAFSWRAVLSDGTALGSDSAEGLLLLPTGPFAAEPLRLRLWLCQAAFDATGVDLSPTAPAEVLLEALQDAGILVYCHST